jgi:hypothetical protein
MSLCSVAQAAISVLEARSSFRRIFEDFGRAQMSQGQARVELDPDFGAHERTEDYHVFVAAEGDPNCLYVSGRSEDGFDVCEQQGRQAPRGDLPPLFGVRSTTRVGSVYSGPTLGAGATVLSH